MICLKRPMAIGICAAAILFTAMNDTSRAALVVSESFDYAAGTQLSSGSLNGGTGFSDAWSGSGNVGAADQIETADMTAPTGYQAQAGNQLLLDTDSPALNSAVTAVRSLAGSIDLDPVSTQTFYISFLVRRDDGYNGAGSENCRYLELRDASNNVLAYLGTTSNEASAISLLGFGGEVTGTDGDLSLSTDSLAVAKLVLNPSGTNDELYLSYFTSSDDVSSEPGSWMASTSADSSGVVTGLGVYVAKNSDQTRFDELRIGTSYTDVIPEPASLGLVLLAMGLAIVRKS